MKLPPVARAIVAAAIAGGALCAAAALRHPSEIVRLTATQWAVLAAVAIPLAHSWAAPLRLYRGSNIETFHLDESGFAIFALLLPWQTTLAAFALMIAVIYTIQRLALVKSAFNVGQVLISASLGLAISHAIAAPGHHLTGLAVLGAAVGAIVYSVVNSAAVAGIVVALGSTWSDSLFGDLAIRVRVIVTGIIVGLPLAVGISSYSWAAAFVIPAIYAIRHVLAAQFRAEHDRERVQGLFNLTLDINRGLHHDAVVGSMEHASVELLHCSDATLATSEPLPGDLGAAVEIGGKQQWLVVSGRPPGQPFDDGDRNLLNAVAAVGRGALANADLYRQVRYERQRLSSIALSIGEAVVALDLEGRLTFANRAASGIISLPAASILIDDQMDLDSLRAPDFLLGPARRCIELCRLVRDENAEFPTADGGTVPVAYTASPILDAGEAVGAVIAFRDMTGRKLLEDELRYQALHDSLTGLANRRLMVERLESLLNDPATREQTHAVVFIDVDRFKGVNDSLGHATGDDLLVAVSRRLQATARPADLLARFGGDEFVALLQDVKDADEAIEVARQMGAAVEEPLTLADGYELVATVSVGVALSEPGATADDLLHDADVAMYHTKVRNHGGTVQLFDRSSMAPRSAVRVQLEADLRKAVERGEIEVHYQPLCSLEDGAVVGAEALVRWRHPELGLLQPAGFVGLAEETGLIIPVGLDVLRQAAEQARLIEDVVGVAMPISVNLSPRQFHHMGLVSDIQRVIHEAGIDPSSITVEITESMVMDDLSRAREVMALLRRAGISIAVDDFGTGHSSLGYLKQFPIQELKIDRSFVLEVAQQPIDRAIVRAVIELAHAMQVVPVAEGIETAEQLETLRALGCRVGQGYHFSRPLPAAEFTALVNRSANRSAERHVDLRLIAKIVTSS